MVNNWKNPAWTFVYGLQQSGCKVWIGINCSLKGFFHFAPVKNDWLCISNGVAEHHLLQAMIVAIFTNQRSKSTSGNTSPLQPYALQCGWKRSREYPGQKHQPCPAPFLPHSYGCSFWLLCPRAWNCLWHLEKTALLWHCKWLNTKSKNQNTAQCALWYDVIENLEDASSEWNSAGFQMKYMNNADQMFSPTYMWAS